MKRLYDWQRRTLLMMPAIFVLVLFTYIAALRDTVFVTFWGRDIAYSFVVYYLAVLTLTALWKDNRKVAGMSAFTILVILEALQYFHVDWPIFGKGVFDNLDFIAYGIGNILALLVDNALNKPGS